MHAARAAGFRPTPQAIFTKKAVHCKSDFANRIPIHAGAGIEVNAQLIGMVEIGRAHRMRMKFHASEINDPRQPRPIVHNQFPRGAAGWEGKFHGAQKGRQIGRCPLLIERFLFSAVDEALENDRPVTNAPKGAWRNRKKVMDQVKLRNSGLFGEIESIRVRNAHLVRIDWESFYA